MGIRRNDVMALAQIATGLGMLTFWILFFTVGMAPAKPPACYFAFEHAFTLPDAVLSVGLLAAGMLQYRLRSEAWAISLACAGGLLFLGLADVSFNLQNGIYSESLAGGLGALAINTWCIALGLALIVSQLRLLRERRIELS